MFDGKMKAVTFSYDDGVTQDIRLVELLNKYGLKATFNINSGFLGQRGILERGGQMVSHYKLAAEDIKRVYEGHEVAVHTLHHLTLTELDDAAIIEQVEQDRINLEKLVGYDVVGMAYPNGPNDDRVAEVIKNNTKVKYVRTITLADNFDRQDNLYRFNPTAYHIMDVKRLFEMGERFINEPADSPKIFYIWGHSYEMDFTNTWNKLEEFFEFISGRDDIYYGTNAQILLK